ncbi:MAG: TetR/AcrR family transcriptional regulator C-terminal domain-containing protein [Oscillospiraceae bacterium]|nr:TetR/AcrR family transcriptional regulator C-terminal domain-containing protein [Oscillospiraceae bacterium]
MNQRIALTKRLLKNSLTEMLQTQSIYEISIRELCQRAGINRSTFYKYYGSQFDLLSEMEQDLLRSVETTLSAHQDYSENIVEQVMEYLEKDIEFVRLLLNSNVDPQFPEKLFSFEPIRRKSLGLKAGMTEEEYEYYYCFILHGAYEMVHKWINKENREPPAWIASLIFHFIRG